MPHRLQLIFIALFCLYSCTSESISLNSQSTTTDPGRLFLVLIGNTTERSIRDGVKKDINKLKAHFSFVAEVLGLSFNPLILSGKDFSKSSIIRTVNNLPTTSNDVLIVVYSGHGKEGEDAIYPDMKLSYGEPFSLKGLQNDYLAKKTTAFTLLLGNCCAGGDINNNFLKTSPFFPEHTPALAEQLKLLYGGTYYKRLAIISAKVPHIAFTHRDKGSYFVNGFIRAMHKNLEKETARSWNKIYQSTKNETDKLLREGNLDLIQPMYFGKF